MGDFIQSLVDSPDLLGVVVTVVLALIGALAAAWRFWFSKPDHRLPLVLGVQDRRYRKAFVDAWAGYDNQYLPHDLLTRKRSLADTYVSLSLTSATTTGSEPVNAFTELNLERLKNLHIFILGAPGSGKSTFLKAYGVRCLGAAPQRWDTGPSRRKLPIFVELRRFADELERMPSAGNRLADYIQGNILKHLVGISDPEAFLRRALIRGRVEVMLDGIDEVPAALQSDVLQAVFLFTQSNNPELPTRKARLLLTSRTENFNSLADEWTANIDASVYHVAPLRDAEMKTYVEQLSDAFADPGSGPRDYLQAVRNSGTLELHRVPLVLAMSVGLFAARDEYQIPNGITELYRRMVSELLERHNKRLGGAKGKLRFGVKDKERFLEHFAYQNAIAESGSAYGDSFGGCAHSQLVLSAAELAPQLNALAPTQAEDFVNEIIVHSGLFIETVKGHHGFAHRSYQEHLVAEYLADWDGGADFLLDRCGDTTWRYVFSLYSASMRAVTRIDDFLSRLVAMDPSLAGDCLAWATPSTAVGESIITQLRASIVSHLDEIDSIDHQMGPGAGQRVDAIRASELTAAANAIIDKVTSEITAMLDATRSPRQEIRAMARQHALAVLRIFVDRKEAYRTLAGLGGGIAQVIEALSRNSAKDIAETVPRIMAAAQVHVDTRLVGPLWRCLQSPDFAAAAAAADVTGNEFLVKGARTIVAELLTIVQDADCLQELQAQEAGPLPAFANGDRRQRVYPFTRLGHAHDSNLVTLLCWADALKTEVASPNRFLEIWRDPGFARVETTWASHGRGVMFWVARTASLAGFAGVVATLVANLATENRTLMVVRGWATVLWVLAPVFLAAAAFLIPVGWASRHPATRWTQRLLPGAPPGPASGNFVAVALAKVAPEPFQQIIFYLVTVAYAFAFTPLLESGAAFVTAAVVAQLVLLWIPFLAVFDRGGSAARRGPLLNVYDDLNSRHWIVDASRKPRSVQ